MSTCKYVAAAIAASFAFAASAQAPAGGPQVSGKERPCQDDPAKCERAAAENRMRQTMRATCEKNPESCQKRHEKAIARRQQASLPVVPAK